MAGFEDGLLEDHMIGDWVNGFDTNLGKNSRASLGETVFDTMTVVKDRRQI